MCRSSHLASCPDCLAYLQSYEAAFHLGRGACRRNNDIDPAPEALIQAVLLARAASAR